MSACRQVARILPLVVAAGALFSFAPGALGQAAPDAAARGSSGATAQAAAASTGGAGATPEGVPARNAPLSERQTAIRERVERFEARMQQLAALLAESEPQQAERLRDALERTRAQRVTSRLEQLSAALREARFSEAERDQAGVIRDLESILELLANPANRMEERRRERERLEARRRAVRQLFDEQNEHRLAAQMGQEALQQAAELGELAERLRELAARQEELRNQVSDPRELAQRQADLQQRAAQAAAALAAAAQAQEQDAARSATASAEQDVRAAAEAMQRAAEKYQAGRPIAEVQAEQRPAEADLHRAVRRLEEQQRRLRDSADPQRAAEAQRGTQRRAQDLHREMTPTEERAEPGAAPLGRAGENMQRAADRMGEGQSKEAEGAQQEALADLQETLDELEEALRQVRQEEQEETLSAIESRLRGILAREESVLEALAALGPVGAREWTRAEELRLADAGASHAKAVEEAETVLRILTEEGTTVIIPELIDDALSDMREAAVRIAKPDTGEAVQAILADVISLLKEMLGAIERKRDENQAQPQGDDQQQQDAGARPAQPLLPRSAELRMLRSSQVRLRDRTAALADAPAANDAEFARLAERQRALAELTRRMHERAE
ncbi:MAG: hypothetical protein IPM64_15735 [Phycisphaerales bacterium]|nr:hypothetical protein [Phycisphaerales bacterium]